MRPVKNGILIGGAYIYHSNTDTPPSTMAHGNKCRISSRVAREEVKVRITRYVLIYPMKPVASRGQPNLEIRYDENTALNRCIDSSFPTKSNHLFSRESELSIWAVIQVKSSGPILIGSPDTYEAQTNP